jgi:amino acid adenylation domain-containing protein
MNLDEFLQNLSTKNVKLWVEGNELCYRGRREVLTPELLNEIKQHKLEIINILNKRAFTPNIYPLSYNQQALWFLYKLVPESAAYNLAFTARICSKLDTLLLKEAFQTLTARHSIIRTTFSEQNGEPVQKVHQFQEVWFEEIDASTWSEDELKQQVVEAYKRPIDLETGAVMRVSLFHVTEGNHVLLLTIHHIACDAWSIWILVEELLLLYTAQKTGAKASLPEINFCYQDFIKWQTQLLNSSQGELQKKYWHQELAGELPILNLPTDRPRGLVQTYHGASHPFKLSQEVVQKLKKLAQVEGITQYMILLAAFEVLLYRYTGLEDILVGSPTAGRSQAEFANIVGYFVNLVVLRANFGDNPTFKSFLAQVRSTVLKAIAHQDYPFPLLVKQLQPLRNPSHSPIFQVSFGFQQSQPEEVVDFPNNSETLTPFHEKSLLLEPFEIAQQEGQFDLSLDIVEAKEFFLGVFKYNIDLFDATTIARMVGHFQTLLEAIVSNPEQRVCDLPLLSAVEQQQLLLEWNQTAVSYPQDKCIHQLFEEQVEQTPDKVAVVFEEQHLTYRELNSRANQLAHYLKSLGVEPEVVVGLCVERSLAMVVAMLGILKAGGAYLPVDSQLPTERLAFMLKDSCVSLLLTQTQHQDKFPQQQARIVCLDSNWEEIAQHSLENPRNQVNPDNLAYLIYTSGSTGKPKGVAVPHRAVRRLVINTNYINIEPKDVVAQVSNCSFDAATFEIWGALLNGASLVIITKDIALSPNDFATKLHEQGITVLFLTTALFNLLASVVPSAFQKMQHLLFGGEAVDPKLVKRVLKNHPPSRLLHLYGPTESTTFTTWYLVKDDTTQETTTIPIGSPVANTQCFVLDNQLQPVPIGVPGELYISGEGLSRGYFNRPELTAQKFIPNPFLGSRGGIRKYSHSLPPSLTPFFNRLYKTGDLARYLPDGNIEYLKRNDNQVKLRGFRIELGEIEAVISSHSGVLQTVVIARVDDVAGDKRLIAYVVPNPETTLSVSELRHFLSKKLPEYMIPSAFLFLEALPLTPNGKVNRSALPSPELAQPNTDVRKVAPRDEYERQLVLLWKDVLGFAPGIKDNFFSLGGHSLLAVKLFAQIEQKFGKKLPLSTLFTCGTVETLAQMLRQQQETGVTHWSTLVAIQPLGSKPPLFCIHPAGGDVLCYRDLAIHLGTDQPLYGLQILELDEKQPTFTRIEDMAALYIREIQTIQKTSPYFLAGYSLGGVIAYEMAQQLHKQGELVGLLAMFDSGIPGSDRLLRLQKRIFIHINNIFRFGLSYLKDSSVRDEINRVKSYIKSYVKDIRCLGKTQANSETEQAIVDLPPWETYTFQVHQQAWERYNFQPYPGSITLFRTDQNYQAGLHLYPLLGWENLVTGSIELHDIPGAHSNLLDEPHVQVLADQLKHCLERAYQI